MLGRTVVLTAVIACVAVLGIPPVAAAPRGTTALTMTLSTTMPTAGETLTVSVGGCLPELGSVAAVTLLRESSLLASVFPITPDASGAFVVPLAIPADVPDGTALVVRAVCGDGDVVSASADADLTVIAIEPAAPPPHSEPDATAAAGRAARPRFTG